MALKYNPATGKLLRTDTPKLVDECPEAPVATCLNTHFVFDLSGAVVSSAPCDAGDCNGFNVTELLPAGSVSINMKAQCPFGAFGDAIIDAPDYECPYTLQVQRCGLAGIETWALDALVLGKFVVAGGSPGGWVAWVGIRSPAFGITTFPANYNFDGGIVADYCMVMGIDLAGSGELIDFAYNFDAIADGFCGTCGASACDLFDISVNASIQLI